MKEGAIILVLGFLISEFAKLVPFGGCFTAIGMIAFLLGLVLIGLGVIGK